MDLEGQKVYSKRHRERSLDRIAQPEGTKQPHRLYRMLDEAVQAQSDAQSQMKRLGKRYPRIKEFREVPGIGPIGSLLFDAFIQTPDRFSTRQPPGRRFGDTVTRLPRRRARTAACPGTPPTKRRTCIYPATRGSRYEPRFGHTGCCPASPPGAARFCFSQDWAGLAVSEAYFSMYNAVLHAAPEADPHSTHWGVAPFFYRGLIQDGPLTKDDHKSYFDGAREERIRWHYEGKDPLRSTDIEGVFRAAEELTDHGS